MLNKYKTIRAKILYRLMGIALGIVLPMLSFAQGPPDPADTPIDGGLSLLLAAGIGYGVKKYRARKAEDDSSK